MEDCGERSPRATILVADDDAAVRHLVADSRRAGYDVLEATTGEEALALADSAPVVLHMSGDASRTDFNDAATGMLISKPFSAAELHEHVNWLLVTRPSR